MANKDISDKASLISMLLAAFLIALYVGNRYHRASDLTNYPKYTVGKVKEFMLTRGGLFVVYEFKVKERNFTGQNEVNEENEQLIGEKFIIKYSSINPKASEILFKYPVPDTLKTIPISGWEELPVLK